MEKAIQNPIQQRVELTARFQIRQDVTQTAAKLLDGKLENRIYCKSLERPMCRRDVLNRAKYSKEYESAVFSSLDGNSFALRTLLVKTAQQMIGAALYPGMNLGF